WRPDPLSDPERATSGADGEARVQQVAARLAALLNSADPVPLQDLALEIDALGAAAISALAGQWACTLPGQRS
ncbi:MAG TPA: hypothetical protein VIG96_07425, partial [Blastococcus sp.]